MQKMTLQDRLRFVIAKIFRKKTLLFSRKDGWEQSIRENLQGYVTFFYEFNEVDPNAFDIVVPLTIRTQKFVNTNPALLAPHKAIIPSDYCMILCNRKMMFHEFMLQNGFEILIPKVNGNLSYPYVLKKNVGGWGIDTLIIYDSKDELANQEKIQSGEYFKQEYIIGRDEYTSHVLISGRNIVFLKTIMFRFRDKYFVKGKYYKPSTIMEVDHSHFKQTFEDVLVKMGYQGICCFNYKIVNQGLVIFEVNPRYGASMDRFIHEAMRSYENALLKAPSASVLEP